MIAVFTLLPQKKKIMEQCSKVTLESNNSRFEVIVMKIHQTVTNCTAIINKSHRKLN